VIRGLLLTSLLLPLGVLAGPGSSRTVVITARMAGAEPAPKITLKVHGTLREVAERNATEGKLNVVARRPDEEAEGHFQTCPPTMRRGAGQGLRPHPERHGAIFTSAVPHGSRRGWSRRLRPHSPCAVPAVPPVPPIRPCSPRLRTLWTPQSAADDEDEADEQTRTGRRADASDQIPRMVAGRWAS
jgi:hypothetical protein